MRPILRDVCSSHAQHGASFPNRHLLPFWQGSAVRIVRQRNFRRGPAKRCMLRRLCSITRTSFVLTARHTHSPQSIRCTSPRFSHSMDTLTESLAQLGVDGLPSIPSAHPDQNPLDLFRTHIAGRLAPLAGVGEEVVFAGLDRATKPDSGDFILAIPRLRIKGAKPDELGKKWQAEA